MRRITGSRGFRIAAVAALAAAAVGGFAGSSAAATAAVVPCSASSLISAISTANTTPADSSITLTSGCVYTLTTPNNTTDGGTGLPVVTGNVSVTGSATIARSAAAGTAAFRIFDVASGGSLTLNSVTLSNGLANDGVNGGGAIFSHGSLTATSATFSGNSSPAATGTSGGAINSSGPLTVSLSTFTGNTAQEGGGIFNQSITAAATVTNSTFSGNTATIFGGGALVSADGTTNLTRDTFSGNSAPGTAGGGAIDNDATVNVTDSTFTGNTAGTNGGGAVQNFGTATISWSTLSGNSSPFGANLHNVTTGSPLTVSDSIVADGLGGGTNCSGSPAVADGGYNIDSGTSCAFSAASHSVNNASPGLGALASNGGPTQTMALAANSPAVNAVPATVPGCAGSTDQRGVSRPQGPACDIGAYELIVPPPQVAVGVEGSGGQMYVQAPQLGSGWKPMGGQIAAPPAVAAPPNPDATTPAQPLFIGTGNNHELYIRSLTAGWQPAGPVTQFCVGGPAAVITGGTLTVACRGTNNALWENTATVPSTGLPQFTTAWTSLGGGLAAGPAVAPVGGVMTFFALGGGSRIYTRTLTTGWQITSWSCVAAPAAALQAVSSETIFACQGATHVLWEAANGGAGWSAAVSLGGSLIGGPAVAATSQVPELLAEGNNNAVWERTLSTGWVSLGGGVTGGVGAAALN